MATGRKKIVNYVSNDTDLQGWFDGFARYLKSPPERGVMELPEEFANGYARVFEISEGLTYRLVDYVLNTDFAYKGPSSPEYYLIIYLYSYKDCKHLIYEVNGKKIVEAIDTDYSSLVMTNSFTNQRFFASKGAKVQGLTIEIKKSWFAKRVNASAVPDLDVLKSKEVFQTMIRPSYKTLMDEILNPQPDAFMPVLYLSSRILRLLEIFFNDIIQNGIEGNELPASPRDVKSLLEVEQYLLQHYREPFPTVPALSRMAMMSGTRLKQIFKKAYGISLFAYFQQNRMYKSKELLQSGVYSVTEVGEMLGYQNLSNFSTAFKKEFGVLPKDFNKLT